MKTISKLTAVALLASVASVPAQAASITGGAQATVVGPLSIANTFPMRFGAFSSGSTAGTITTNGVTTGGVSLVTLGSPGTYNVAGTPNASFDITAPNSVTLTNGSASMTAAIVVPTASALDAQGNRAFNITGTLSVGANQPTGNYTGSFPMTVNY